MCKIGRLSVLMVLILSFCFNVAFGEEEILLYEDFSNETIGETPSLDWIIKETGGKVTIVNTNPSKKELNMLNLKDTDDVAGVTAMKTFPIISGKLAIDIKFKIDSPLGVVEFSAGNKDELAYKMTVGSDGTVICSNGSSTATFSKTKITSGNWNSLRVIIDPTKNKAEARINREILTNLSLNSDYNSDSINYIMISTKSGKPDVLVDYLLVEKGDNLSSAIKPPKAPEVDDPVIRLVPDRINVILDGEILYLSDKPILRNDRVLMPLRSTFEILNMEIMWNDETKTVTAKNKDYLIELTEGSKEAKVNKEIKMMDTSAEIVKGSMYVPLRFVSEAIGAEVSWNGDNETVIINR